MSDRRAFLATIDRVDRLEAELDRLRRKPLQRDYESAFEDVCRIDALTAELAGQSSTAARLVYADWLEEHGEHEHAELIRVQCEAASVPSCLCEGKILKWQTPMRACRDVFPKPHYGKGQGPYCNPCLTFVRLRARGAELLEIVATTEIDGRRYRYGSGDVWDRGLLVSAMTYSWFCRAVFPAVSTRHPVRTIRLTDWHGIDRSLPPNPREALPWLRRLELPASAASPSGATALEYEDSVYVGGVALRTIRDDYFGRDSDGTPRVEVAFWDDGPVYGVSPLRAAYPAWRAAEDLRARHTADALSYVLGTVADAPDDPHPGR